MHEVRPVASRTLNRKERIVYSDRAVCSYRLRTRAAVVITLVTSHNCNAIYQWHLYQNQRQHCPEPLIRFISFRFLHEISRESKWTVGSRLDSLRNVGSARATENGSEDWKINLNSRTLIIKWRTLPPTSNNEEWKEISSVGRWWWWWVASERNCLRFFFFFVMPSPDSGRFCNDQNSILMTTLLLSHSIAARANAFVFIRMWCALRL